MMSRQAYFYRVPPQELHRRNQLQADPAKTRALQTVIDMKVGLRVTLTARAVLSNNVLECVYWCNRFIWNSYMSEFLAVYHKYETVFFNPANVTILFQQCYLLLHLYVQNIILSTPRMRVTAADLSI